MCDTALSFAKEHLLPLARDHLLPLLKEAANMIRGVPKEIEELKDELENIEKFINDADRIAEEDNTRHGIRAKITQLIEASFFIQDVIDEYMMMCEEQQPGDNPGCAAGASDLLKTTVLRLQIAYKIQNIKSRINDVKDASGRDDVFLVEGGASSSSANTIFLQNLQHAPLYILDNDVVGFDDPKNDLIDLLTKGRAELTIVSVVAMGGQGKTTLVKKVFDNTKVTQYFNFCVWITVSRSYTIKVLLRNMLNVFYKHDRCNPPQDISEMDLPSLIQKVRDYLRQKRYVIVFDDVWQSHFWDAIEYALFDNNNGSRILITTRNMEVVLSCKRSSFVEVYELLPLTPKESLELFNKKAFRDLNECCPNNLKDISFKIVEKCKQLPLAIVVIGGLLSRKERNLAQWQKFCQNLNLELKKHTHLIQIKKILGFSYHDLPYNLKSCFLYFGLYPEDYIVNSKNLIRQWIAEGFVKEEMGKSLEEVAERYLTELIHRSLVQVYSFNIDGRPKSCRVHDLLYVMIVEKFEDLKFCKNIGMDGQSSISGIIRRLSLTSSIDLLESIESSHVRSMMLFALSRLHKSFVKRMSTKYKTLKVLAFESHKKVELPEYLGCLVNLKYLGLRGQYMKYFKRSYSIGTFNSNELPKSIGMLQNLETLDLRGTRFVELPKEITMLRKLQHLLAYANSWIQLKDGIGEMTSLQTLGDVEFHNTKFEFETVEIELIKELGKLKQLRELCLTRLPRNHGSSLSSSINEMQHLENLKIVSPSKIIDLHLISPPPMLQSLKLIGKLQKLPEWIPKHQNLVKLKLNYSMLSDDPVKSLKDMQSLLSLSINIGAYKADNLHFQEGEFQNLKELYLEHSIYLKSIIIDKGALSCLKKLQLCSLYKLKRVPDGIQHLKMLEALVIQGMSKEFEHNLSLTEKKENWDIEYVFSGKNDHTINNFIQHIMSSEEGDIRLSGLLAHMPHS